ncbi:flagellar biosynthesis protein FlgA [Zhihengliuella salsuginis]|uniref:Flagellar protein FlgA n=1 Tax=Zhihengliuella salsuginis TaxID=578222 RepID=A0ABQ3GD60_9MICC|nr:flagellar biosynthesis protein FlgA [Zhihengliuella salsuginis]GHD00890.1 flagellar protein FlgA [Zhihengliuella salsuginis]
MSAEGTSVPTETKRLQRPGWRDPRLIIGLLLVVASIAGVVGLVTALDRTVDVYAAKDDLTVGEQISTEDLSVVEVRVDGMEDMYVSAGAPLEDGVRASAFVKAGELIPARAVVGTDQQGRKPVSVPVDGALSEAISVGGHVDVWSAAPSGVGNEFGEPARVLQQVEVASVADIQSGFGGTSGTNLELLVTDDELPALLGALANDAKITVVYSAVGGEE